MILGSFFRGIFRNFRNFPKISGISGISQNFPKFFPRGVLTVSFSNKNLLKFISINKRLQSENIKKHGNLGKLFPGNFRGEFRGNRREICGETFPGIFRNRPVFQNSGILGNLSNFFIKFYKKV